MPDIQVTVAPADATDKTYTVVSSDPTIVSVDGDGNCSALAAGEATLTITTTDGGFTATCDVTVAAATVAVTGVTVDKTTKDATVGDDFTVGQ
jgi:uncharacterized protein YjdB